jgi:hypothetical protein
MKHEYLCRTFPNWQHFTNGTLALRRVQIENAGKYECVAGNKAGMKRREAVLCVKRE